MSITTQIPVIDISGDVPEAEVAEALVDAVATNGFVYVKNLGKDIPIEMIERTFGLVSILNLLLSLAPTLRIV
jgi:hypothetical protein